MCINHILENSNKFERLLRDLLRNHLEYFSDQELDKYILEGKNIS